MMLYSQIVSKFYLKMTFINFLYDFLLFFIFYDVF
jgi:hypothetical protein